MELSETLHPGLYETSRPDETADVFGNIIYSSDHTMSVISASGRQQMPDGAFMLSLPGGKTKLISNLMSDTTLTDKSFMLVFDDQIGVKPQ